MAAAVAGALVGALVAGGISYNIAEHQIGAAEKLAEEQIAAAKEEAQRERDAARPGIVKFSRLMPAESLEHVPRTVSLEGSAQIPPDANKRDLWIVVEVGVAASYYPQGNVSVDTGGHWKCTFTLGSKAPDDDGAYTVIAVLADAPASSAMRRFIKKELPTTTGGMADYPASSVDTRASFSVVRDSDAPEEITRAGNALGC